MQREDLGRAWRQKGVQAQQPSLCESLNFPELRNLISSGDSAIPFRALAAIRSKGNRGETTCAPSLPAVVLVLVLSSTRMLHSWEPQLTQRALQEAKD